MDLDDEDGVENPFRRPDFYRSSALDAFLTSTEGHLFPDIDFQAPLKPLNTVPIIQIDTFSFENPFSLSISSPPESLASSDDVLEPVVDESTLQIEEEEADIWLESAQEVTAPAGFLSWETFVNGSLQDAINCYITEAGNEVFNAAISLTIGNVPVADGELLFRSLIALGLGRNSLLFKFDVSKASFQSVKSEFRLNGCSDTATESLVTRFRRCGDTFRKLEDTVDRVFSKTIPGLFALRDVLSSALDIIQERIYVRAAEAKSILQLDEVFEIPSRVLHCLEQVTSLMDVDSDVQLMNSVFNLAMEAEQADPLEYGILLYILRAVSSHWLKSVEGWIGTSRGRFELLSRIPAFAKRVDEDSDSEFELVPEKVPSFLLEQDTQLLFYAGQTLRLLEKHDPEHPLVQNRTLSSAPRLEWHFQWQDARTLTNGAEQYEKLMKDDIKAYYECKASNSRPEHRASLEFVPAIYGSSDEEIQISFALQTLAMERVPPVSVDSSLRSIIVSADTPESATSFSPPLLLSSSLSFSPIIAAQNRLINTAALRLVFEKHQLLEHISILKRFYLFADSAFVSRLSDALFTSKGLALSSTSSWPPASSELQLALADVLSTSLKGEPPGGLSFSIREMEEADLEKCLDAGSIAALDFLKLSYTAPDTLGRVISEKSLERYDVLFQFLLRLLRVDATARRVWMKRRRDFTLSPAASRVTHDVLHFLTVLKTYFLTIAIERPWAELTEYLSNLRGELLREETSVQAIMLDDLRQRHEEIVETMVTACLLRKRQGQVQAKIESALTQILQLCSGKDKQDEDQAAADEKTTIARGEALRKDIQVIVAACSELSDERDRAGSSLLKEFVLLLDYSGRYSMTRL